LGRSDRTQVEALHTIMHFGNPYTFMTALFITQNETKFLQQKHYIW